MGAVYQARQPALDRFVALKVLPAGSAASPGFEERFNREARALARLNHPNIVAVYEFGRVGDLLYFLMEFVDGATLRQLGKTSGLSTREALQIIPQICDALQYAHDEGVVHRDIKPENVLVDRKGRVKIADFGLAKILDLQPESARLTVEGQVMGTPHYMAPEQIERPLAVDHRADIYSLGVVLYEMLTGDLPLGKFPPPSRKVQVDVRFDEVVLRALENDPEQRYQKASEVKSRVETIAGTPAPSAERAGRKYRIGAAFALAVAAWCVFQVGWLNPWLRAKSTQSTPTQVALRDPSSGALVAILPHGRSLELFAVANTGESPKAWWAPDGSRLTNTSLEVRGLANLSDRNARTVDLAFRVVGEPPKPGSSVFEFDPDTEPSFGGTVLAAGRPIPGGWSMRAVYSPDSKTATLGFGYPEAWRTVLAHAPASGSTSTSRQRGDPGWPTNLTTTEHGLSLRVAIVVGPHAYLSNDGMSRNQAIVPGPNAKEWRLRAVVVDLDGVEHVSAELTEEVPEPSGWTFTTWTFAFPELPLDRVKKILLQAQRVQWVEFRDVALEPLATDIVATRDTVSGALTATLPERGNVELLALGEPEAAAHGWWTSSGTPIADATFEVRDICPVDGEDNRQLDVVFRVPGHPDGSPVAAFRCEQALREGAGGEARRNGVRMEDGWPLRLAWPTNLQTATLRAAFGTGEWKTLSRHEPFSASTIWNRDAANPDLGIGMHGAADSPDGLQVTFVLGKIDENWRVRMVAVDSNGTEHPSTVTTESSTGVARLKTYLFPGVERSATREIRVQAQRLSWVQFPEVHLFPNQPVPAPVRSRFGPARELNLRGFLNLDNGKTETLAAGSTDQSKTANGEAKSAWMQEHELHVESRAQTLGFAGLRVAYLDPADWENLSPSRLNYLLGDLTTLPAQLEPPSRSLPVTLGFRTSAGTSGMLQVLSYAGSEPAARIRIKTIVR